MQSKSRIIAQAILLFAMAALFAVVPILSLQQEKRTDLTTVTATEIDGYVKKPVKMDSGDYKILSGSSMWERHQAAGEELSGDYMTAFYPLEVHAKNGDSYVIAVELDADEKDVYYIKNAPIKGNILPIPAEHLEDFRLATVGQNICSYYLSTNSRTPAGEAIGAVVSGILAVLFAISGIALLTSTKQRGQSNGYCTEQHSKL